MGSDQPFLVPFNRPYLAEDTMGNIRKAHEQRWLSGGGAFSVRCEEWLERSVGCKKALLTTSCTHALEMCGLLLDLKPGDEVIVPSYTFVSSANAFVLRGVTLRFVDIREDTLNFDETLLEDAITERTKAIVVVHYGGVGCEMNEICRIAEKYDIPVIEDNAHGLLGQYEGKSLGTFGSMATLSFHETKNFTCGEGGALLINDERYIKRAEVIREKGTNRSAFFRGEVDKYTWEDVGSSYVISDLLAAVLFAQFEEAEIIQGSRERAWNYYYEGLKDLEDQGILRLPVVPDNCLQAYHLFYVLLGEGLELSEFLAGMKQSGVHTVFHYLPLHSSKMGQELDPSGGACPVTDRISEVLVRLPFFTGIVKAEQDKVIRTIHDFVVKYS